MKYVIAAAALCALAACSPPAEEAKQEAPPAAPTDALSALQAQSPENQPVHAWQQLTAWQSANSITPACASIRRAEARGVVPANIQPASIYAPYVGSTIFAVQCGPQLTTVRDNPAEHWLVIFTPGAAAPTILNCADPAGLDRCRGRVLPTVEAAPPAAAP